MISVFVHWFSSFPHGFCRIFYLQIRLSVKEDSFTSSFSVWTISMSFSCFTVLARSRTILSRSGERYSLVFFTDLRRKAAHLSSLRVMFAVGFFLNVLYQFEEVPVYS